jgi:uncharacterized phage protein (TIGR02216 family)
MSRPSANDPRPFPWEETMGFLLGVLGWPPQAAWGATPREVALAIAGRSGSAPSRAMDGAGLSALMQAYPDQSPAGIPEETDDG